MLQPTQIRFSLIFCLFCLPALLGAQVVLNGNFQRIPLADALRQLEQNGNLRIAYDPVLVQPVQVNVVFSGKKIQDAFDLLLRETNLTADILDDHYVVLRQRGEPPPEPVTLCGRLLDAETREPLVFATVRGKGYAVQTNLSGKFTCTVAPDRLSGDSLSFFYLGYQPASLPARALARKDCPDVLLKPATQRLMEIVVTDQALDPVRLPAAGTAQTEVRPDRGRFVPSLGEPDPFRMIQFLPGVTAVGDKAGELLVRGGASDQNLVLWEGIPIYHTGHLFGVVSALNPYVVNSVDVWKGNFGAQQGGRASSLIEMRADAAIHKRRFSIGLNQWSGYISYETPLFHQKGGLLVAGRSAFSDLIQNPIYRKLFGYATQESRISQDQQTKNSDSLLLHTVSLSPVSQFSDANLKFYLNPSDRTHLSLSAYSGTDILRYAVNANVKEWNFYYKSQDTATVKNVGASLRLQQRWSDRYRSEWQLAWSGYLSRYDYGGSFDSVQFPLLIRHQRNTVGETVFRFDNTWQLNSRSEFRFGFQSTRSDNTFEERYLNLPEPAKSSQWGTKLPSNLSAFYGIWRLGEAEKWALELGLRNVTFNYTSRPYWEPRFSTHYSIGPYWQLKANGGVYRQFMRQAYIWNELGLNNEVWFTADDNGPLPVLRNRQIAAGFAFSKNRWLLDVETYAKSLNPLSGVNLRINGDPQVIWNARGVEYARGLEVLLRYRYESYTNWLSYTYGHAEARFDSLNAGIDFPSDYDQRHTLNWAHYFDWPRWAYSVAWNFHTGRPYTPPAGIQETTDANGLVTRQVTYGARNSERLPSYSRLDMSLLYKFHRKRLNGSIGLAVYNFLDRANIQNRTFFVEEVKDTQGVTQYRIGSLEQPLLGNVANLFILLRF